MTRTQALNILFDSLPTHLTRMEIQKAFSRKMKEVHPDLNPGASSVATSETIPQIIAQIKEARDLLQANPRFNRMAHPRKPGFKQRTFTETPSTRSQHSGEIPQRPLRFGQYLYYRGILDWNNLIQAIIAQRSARPGFGTLALEMGILNQHQIDSLKGRIRPGIFIGDVALELGMLTPQQVTEILVAQRKYYFPLGRVLVDRGYVTMRELSRYLWDFHSHQMVSADRGRPRE